MGPQRHGDPLAQRHPGMLITYAMLANPRVSSRSIAATWGVWPSVSNASAQVSRSAPTLLKRQPDGIGHGEPDVESSKKLGTPH